MAISTAYRLCVKLYILFIDFEKAYVKLSRKKLIEELMELGCGRRMLKMIVAMYTYTSNCYFPCQYNVGASTISLLFIIYFDKMMKMLKQSCDTDGSLGALHPLMLMDDTVLLSTTRERSMKKFQIVQKYCVDYNEHKPEKDRLW